ncbi:Arabinose efflux permease family protein [Azospirillaceae bacterium]
MSPPARSSNVNLFQRVSSRISKKLLVLSLLLLTLAAASFSWFALQKFEDELSPELAEKASTIGKIVSAQVQSAVLLGVPFNELVGVKDFLRSIIEDNPEISYISITYPNGNTLYSEGASYKKEENALHALLDSNKIGAVTSSLHILLDDFINTILPIYKKDILYGYVHVGTEKTIIEKALKEVVFDVLVIFLTAMIITFEALLLLMTRNVNFPLRVANKILELGRSGNFVSGVKLNAKDEIHRFVGEIDNIVSYLSRKHEAIAQRLRRAESQNSSDPQTLRSIEKAKFLMASYEQKFHFSTIDISNEIKQSGLVSIRAPLFSFMFAEELSRSFFPLYVKELFKPIPGLSANMVIGLPIAFFMLIVALFTPICGTLVDRWGARRLVMLGLIPAIAGFVGTAQAENLYQLLLYRSLVAIGYAAVFIGAQGYIAKNTTAENRAAGMANFVGAVIGASICGVSIGGILAEQIGYRATFFISALLAIIAGALVSMVIPRESPNTNQIQKRAPLLHTLIILKNIRFISLLLFSSIPTKLVLTGYLFYLAPLYLHDMALSKSEIGRYMMAYSVIIIIFMPIMARWADRTQKHALFVALGGLLTGAGGLILLIWQSSEAVLASIIAIGMAHALNNATQLALAPEVSQKECASIGVSTMFSFYRLIERGGAIIGPIVSATLASFYGYNQSIIMLSLGAFGCSVLFSLVFLVFREKKRL